MEKSECCECKAYKLAYLEMMNFWDSINEDDQIELGKRLDMIFEGNI